MKTITTLFAFLTIFYIQAQTIRGTFLTNDQNPIEFNGVTLHKFSDSTLVKGEFTSAKGEFEFTDVENGEYIISFEYLGYESYKSTKIVISNGLVDLGKIYLKVASQELSEVTVKARKPLIEMQADKMILNTDASISTSGANGLELLRKAPGVTIDNNENIILKGKNGVRIYIDGKPSFLSAQELTSLLKSLTSADIETIEIITNPSAKYDAEGNAGIINLKLRKNKNYGTNGNLNLSAGYGKYHKSYVGLSLNNRNKKTNIYGNAGIGNDKYYNEMNLLREQDGGVFDQEQSQVSTNYPLNGKFGIDYYANSKHTFGFLINANTQYKDNVWKSTSKTNISGLSTRSKIDSILNATSTITSRSLNVNANINYRFEDTLGNEVTFDIDRGMYDAKSNNMQPNIYIDGETNKELTKRAFTNNTPSAVMINTAKLDYNKFFKSSNVKLSVGAKYANVITDNTFSFYNFINGVEIKDPNQSNVFKYTENVLASYINISGSSGKNFSYQAGLRMENTKSIGDLKREPGIPAKPQDYRDTSYLNLFPSAALTYSLNENNSFNLTYSRRLDRPNYQDLNPFEWRLDELTFRKGNPFLRPQYNNNLEFTYTVKQMASIGLSYSKSKDVVSDVVERDIDNPNKSFINYRNIASSEQFSLTVNSPLPVKSWWNGYVSASLYKAFFKARFPEYSFDVQTPIAFNLYMEHTFTLSQNSFFEVSGWANSASVWQGSWLSEPQGSLDLGYKQIIMGGKANIKIGISDIFFTAPWRAGSEAIPGLSIKGNGAWESRKVSVNFNYKFGNSNVKAQRNRKTGLEEENKRIKS